MDWALVAIGLVILTLAGEATVRGAVGMARQLGVSPAVIGVTVIGFGTSAPELVVTLQAALADQPDLAIGNVVGSNISNLLLILGVGAAIAPMTCDRRGFTRDAGMMLIAVLLLVGLSQYGVIVWWHGALMFATLIAYIAYSYISDQRDPGTADLHSREAEEVENVPERWILILPYLLAGLAGLVGGAALLIEGAVGIARDFGVPESIIGLTLVALGTSLPELAATVVAAMRKHTDVAIGNILGSCTFNVLSILGLTALVSPLTFAADIQGIDIWVMLAATLAVVGMLIRGLCLRRWKGWVLLGGYAAYIAHIATRF